MWVRQGRTLYDGANAGATGDCCCRSHRRETGLGDTRPVLKRHGGVQVKDDTPQYARRSGCTSLSQVHEAALPPCEKGSLQAPKDHTRK